MVDLAMIQSLSRLDNPEGLFQRYGAVVIDECHHLPAFSFESCVRRAPARHVLGLTATPYRRDGLQGIITMQCGPIRHTISPRDAEPDAPRPHLRVRATDFGLEESDDASIQEVFRALVNDQQRTALVCEESNLRSTSTPWVAATCARGSCMRHRQALRSRRWSRVRIALPSIWPGLGQDLDVPVGSMHADPLPIGDQSGGIYHTDDGRQAVLPCDHCAVSHQSSDLRH
jgi:superfamily II DNA or RNA helicase